VPLAFIAYVPALQLVRGTDWPMAGLGVLWAIAFFLGSRAFWRFAMSHYTSASS
jgi:ABC-2 type transport system permease protein